MTARFIVADVFDGLATLKDGSVDLVVTSPPFLALRSYLPADHPDKGKEIGSESTPAEFIDTLLRVTAELRRVLAPHGSICVELGDTYAGSGGGGGDYLEDGWREGQQQFAGSQASMRESNAAHWRQKNQDKNAWPLAKSRTLIPSLYQIALAYGFNPLTGLESPAGQWRVRNIVTWARPNPPVGALGDKWRPATSDLIVACTSSKRYWDDLATRKPHLVDPSQRLQQKPTIRTERSDLAHHAGFGLAGSPGKDGFTNEGNPSGAPLLDYWVIPPTGYTGAHYAVFPPELVEPCVKAMCPQKVCVTCREPSRRIIETQSFADGVPSDGTYVGRRDRTEGIREGEKIRATFSMTAKTLGWSDCGHDNWRPGLILDPFAGSGTTLSVATGHGHDAIGIDIDSRNVELARDRVGPFLFDEVTV